MQRHPSSVSRRTVSAGLAWSVPSVAAVAAAPAHAASPCVPGPGAESFDYAFAANPFSFFWADEWTPCDSGFALVKNGLVVDNESFPVSEDPTPPPAGFAVLEQPKTDGSGDMSPKIDVTLPAPVQYVVAYPTGIVDRSGEAVFTFYNGTDSNWSAPEYKGTQTLRGGEDGQKYDMFAFTWLGDRTQSTVAPSTGNGDSPEAWASTALAGEWTTVADLCLEPGTRFLADYYLGGASDLLDPGSFTTSNCVTVAAGTGVWHELEVRVPRG